MTFASHVKNVSVRTYMFGIKKVYLYENLLYSISVTLNQGHSFGID